MEMQLVQRRFLGRRHLMRYLSLPPIISPLPFIDYKPDSCGRAGHQRRQFVVPYLASLLPEITNGERSIISTPRSINGGVGTNDSFPARPRRSSGRRWTAALGPGCVKTRAFNLLVERSSQNCWRRLSEEGNRETGSTLSWLAHVFTRPGSKAVLGTGYQASDFHP